MSVRKRMALPVGMLILLVLTAYADNAPVSDTEDTEEYSVISEREEDAVPEETETILDHGMEGGEGMDGFGLLQGWIYGDVRTAGTCGRWDSLGERVSCAACMGFYETVLQK